MAGRTHEIKILLALMFAALTLAAQPVVAQEETSPTLNLDDWPEWLLDAMAKESPGLKPTPIELPTRSIVMPIIGDLIGEPTDTGNGWYLSSDIGGSTPMECWVLTEAIDPVTTVANIAEISMNSVAQINGEIANEFNYYADGGVIGKSRYFAYEKVYTAGEADARVVGLTKVRIASVDDIHIACGHNEVGYRETFARGFEQLILGVDLDLSANQPYLREIINTKLGDQVISVLEFALRIDADGDLAISSVESTLMPIDASTVSTSDSYAYSYWTPDGDLISNRTVSIENGEIGMNIDLLPLDEGGYSASGLFQGKEIDYTIDAEHMIISEVDQLLQTQQFLGDSEQESLVIYTWEPTVDPTRFIPVTMKLEPDGRADRRVVVSVGPIEMQAQLDKFGSLESASFSVGPNNASMKRIFIEGESPVLELND